GVKLVHNINIPVNAASLAGDVGNGSQNGHRTQMNTEANQGSTVGIADNANVQLVGAGVAGVVGNGAQNGSVKQENISHPRETSGGHTWGWGSGIKLFRNIHIPVNGAGVAGVVGNGSQNQHVSQVDNADNSGSTIGIK